MGNTPNLNLYKGTPGSSTETFNVQTMLNDNWDKLDTEVVKKASTTDDGRLSKEDKAKLDGIEVGATNYQHPATHSATIITQDTTHRFVTDAEKTTWNGKAEGNHTHTPASIGAEPAFAKKTAFNKDFGIAAGTVAEGSQIPLLKTAMRIDKGTTILAANWVDDTTVSGYWTYSITDAEVDANTIVDVYFHLASLDGASDVKGVESFAGSYKLYATAKPTVDLVADIRKTREVV